MMVLARGPHFEGQIAMHSVEKQRNKVYRSLGAGEEVDGHPCWNDQAHIRPKHVLSLVTTWVGFIRKQEGLAYTSVTETTWSHGL